MKVLVYTIYVRECIIEVSNENDELEARKKADTNKESAKVEDFEFACALFYRPSKESEPDPEIVLKDGTPMQLWFEVD